MFLELRTHIDETRTETIFINARAVIAVQSLAHVPKRRDSRSLLVRVAGDREYQVDEVRPAGAHDADAMTAPLELVEWLTDMTAEAQPDGGGKKAKKK